jgi:[acyl-carrier-protein] S-malonyltransferase
MSINPLHTAFVFPGQGSQSIGMGKELATRFPIAAQVFSQADELLGFKLSDICWEGPSEALNDTLNTQPAILVHSIAVLTCLQETLPEFQPAIMAGHSLGEISALVAAGAIGFTDGVRLVRARGEAMKYAGEQDPGGMAAVLGLPLEAVEDVCQTIRSSSTQILQIANDNCPGQVVISGTNTAIDLAIEDLKSAGAKKVVRLQVSIPAHSELMHPAQSRFHQALDESTILETKIPVIGNVEVVLLSSKADIREDLYAQLTSRVRWTETIELMLKMGITTFIELGSGEVLTRLIRRIDRSVTTIAIGDPKSMDIFLQSGT